MTKVNSKKSNAKVGGENKKSSKESKRLEKESRELMERGNTFGDFVLDLLDLFIVDWKDFGSASIGLARAVAALKQEARNEGVPVDKLFQSQLEFFEKEFADLGSEE
jgi:hypothetical protein